MTKAFFARSFGTKAIEELSGRGLLIGVKLSGRISFGSFSAETGELFTLFSDGTVKAEDSGISAYALLDGELVDALCGYYSVRNGSRVSYSECPSDMMELISIAFITASAAYILNALGFGGTRVFLVFGSVVMLLFVLRRAGDVISELIPLFYAPVGELADAALRVVGIGYIGGFFSDACLELGARGAADAISLFLRVEIVALVMPYFIDILSLAGGLIL